jgi:hypothetical protein
LKGQKSGYAAALKEKLVSFLELLRVTATLLKKGYPPALGGEYRLKKRHFERSNP